VIIHSSVTKLNCQQRSVANTYRLQVVSSHLQNDTEFNRSFTQHVLQGPVRSCVVTIHTSASQPLLINVRAALRIAVHQVLLHVQLFIYLSRRVLLHVPVVNFVDCKTTLYMHEINIIYLPF
jgi:hypothetical protein